MKNLLLRLYDWLITHRRVLWIGLTVVLGLLASGALSLHYNEDIMDFLPVTEEDREALERYQEQEIASRLVLIIEGEDENLRNEALEACEEAIPDLETDIDPAEQLEAVYALMPYYIEDSTYAQLDSLLQPEAIQAALQRDKTILSTPGTSFLAPTIQHDPLGLVNLSNIKYQISNNKSFAFVDSPYGGTETIKNAPLVDSLTATVEQIAQQFPALNIRWVGAPVISVANAQRIKLDSILCISLSLVLIVALLLYAFPRRRDILLILSAVLFGWLVGMAVLRLFTPSVSAVVLGIGSVLIGIAVNYPLHLLVHQRYTTSVRQTLDEVLSPLVVGNITTVGAFLTLVPLQASALRHLGIFAASMLIGTIVFCVFVLPHLMSAEPTPVREIKVNFNVPISNIKFQISTILQWCIVGLTVLFGVYLLLSPLTSHVSPLFDSNLHNINYITPQQDADMTAFELPSGEVPQWTEYWKKNASEEVIARVQTMAAQEGFKPEAFEPFYATLRTWQPVKAFDAGVIAERLSADFDYIGICCSLIVFFFLWLSFRSFWLALIAFIPMALSWVWIIAIMQFFGLQFNIVNIILATFIFGQGDDYTIFVVEGLLYEHRTGKTILPQYKQSILLSALIMLVGIGILVLAVHPAMHSLGVITLIGMSIVLLMAMTIPPLLFKLYVKWGSCKNT
ncbi:MAG: MMPL family transporter [Paludibacteraceae bacterium]|nr:MMPL family transporter [Paludibacteraceae bacterium]